MSSNVDRFGIQKIFPDKPGGTTLFGDGPNWFEKYSKHGYESIKNVKIFRKTFGFRPKINLGPNLEATIYVFIPRLNPEYGSHPKIGKCSSGSGLSIKLRGGTHSNSSKKSAKCYVFHFEYEGGDCNNFQKEYPHPKYQKKSIKEENKFPNWVGRIMGFKAITINNSDSVDCFAYFDPDTLITNTFNEIIPKNGWKLRYHVRDKGQLFNGRCKKPFFDNNGKYIEFRMDNVPKDTLAFAASLREIVI